jgi:hypothetical protein
LHPPVEKQPQDKRQQVDMGRGKAYLRVIFIPAFAPKLAVAVVPADPGGRTGRPAVRSSIPLVGDDRDATQDKRLEGLREQRGCLRRQLDEEREACRRADTIIAQLVRAIEEQAHTIRELRAPQESA